MRVNKDCDDFEDRNLLHSKLTRTIIGCAFEVSNELGVGFLESVYEKALVVALESKGLKVLAQHPITVVFRGRVVGEYIADLFVEQKIIVELKAAKALAAEHQAQVINYLNATGAEVGLLLNFGRSSLEVKRLYRSKGAMSVGHVPSA